jgi:Mce-associated membrane protein
VLVYLNQYRRNVNITGEKIDQNRVVLTMTRVDGHWKVTGAQAI